jgi:hypothetical protein
MKTYNGFDELLAVLKVLPYAWIITQEAKNSRDEIDKAKFFVPDDEEEEEEMFEKRDNNQDCCGWMEAATFQDIISNKLARHPDSTRDDFLDAVVYYREMDDFLD